MSHHPISKMGDDSMVHLDKEHDKYLMNRLNQLRLRGNFIDVLIVCGTTSFPAHRVVLCSRSTFFKRFLQDTDTKTLCTVHMKEVPDSILDVLLNYMYLGEMSTPGQMTLEMLLQLITTAQKMEIEGAVANLTNDTLQRNNNSLIPILWDWSAEFGNKDVEQAIVSYIIKNLKTLLANGPFPNLLPKRLLLILAQPEIRNVESVDDLITSLIEWIKIDIENRRLLIVDIVSKLNLRKVSEHYARMLLSNEPVFGEMLDAYDRIHLPSVGHRVIRAPPQSSNASSPTKSISAASSRAVSPLMPMVAKLNSPEKVGILKHTSPTRNLCEKPRRNLSPETEAHGPSIEGIRRIVDSWHLHSLERKNIPLFDQALSFSSGPSLLVVGMDDVHRIVAQLYVPDKSIWSMSQDLNIPYRSNMMYAYNDRNLYMFGGEDANGHKYSETYIYNMATQKTAESVGMRIARSCAGVGLYQNYVYLVGGINRFGNAMTHVERFDMNDPSWHIIPSLLQKRHFPGVSVNSHGRLFVIGGNTTRCESLDLMEDAWTELVPLPEILRESGMFSTIYNDLIYSFRNFKPDRMCSLDPIRNELRVVRTIGTPPEDVVSFVNVGKEFWILERSGKLFVYDIETYHWDKSFSCPKTLLNPMYITVIDLDDISNAYAAKGEHVLE